MITISQAVVLLITIWAGLMIVAIIRRINYVATQMGSPMEQGDIWSRRKRRRKINDDENNSDFDDDTSEESLEMARQERGKRMREFNKKREKVASKAKERKDFLMKGKSGDELKDLLTYNNKDDQGPIGPPDSDWMMLGESDEEETLDQTMKKKIVVEYEDTKSTTHGNFHQTISARLNPRDTIMRRRTPQFKINDRPLSWTV